MKNHTALLHHLLAGLYFSGALWLLPGPLMAAAEKPPAAPTYLPPPPRDLPSPAVTDVQQREATKQIHVKKVILVGDSTMQVDSGWGGAFCAHHLDSHVTCVNLGRGGRSTFSYRAEGSWQIALNEMKVPGYDMVYVLIQFGHNDQPGKPGRTTDLYTEFPQNLARYVQETRAAGAIPVLVTPITRRSFKHGSLQDALRPWADAARKVAEKMEVPLVDLHAVSMAAVQKMGPRAALELSETLPPPKIIAASESGTTAPAPKTKWVKPAFPNDLAQPQGRRHIVFDYTHLGAKGAAFFSTEVAGELARVVPDLRKDLIP